MIGIIIVLLAIILIGLVVDWGSLVNKLGKKSKISSKKITANLKNEKSNESFEEGFMSESIPQYLNSAKTPAPVVASVAKEQVKSKKKAQPDVDKLLAEADTHFRKGEMKAAEDLYVQVAAKDPRCSKAYSRLGVIYLEHEECLEDAESAFRQALKIEPNNGFILNNLGLVLYHQDKFADAIRNFESALRLDEYNAGRQANLGLAYLAMRQYAKAESSFKRALKLAPNEAEYKDLLNEAIEKKKAHKSMIRR